ncbi:MAG TPA: Lrp/AsnC family transcriptional regulator [Deltaproteobacteria bacterium]|nr:Lrp/AsnC family transcriptional regulator [Deltaproteobacteria bacterium]
MMLTEREQKVARFIQRDISGDKRPFKTLGTVLGMTEEDALNIIKALASQGIVRKFGAVLRHTRAGLTQNAMVVWAVPEDEIDFIGTKLASYREVTHCYERTPSFEEKYNLFSMIHFKGENADDRLRRIADDLGISDYIVLVTEQEFKKVSMEYF